MIELINEERGQALLPDLRGGKDSFLYRHANT